MRDPKTSKSPRFKIFRSRAVWLIAGNKTAVLYAARPQMHRARGYITRALGALRAASNYKRDRFRFS